MKKSLLFLVSLLMLTSCGGGGDGGSPTDYAAAFRAAKNNTNASTAYQYDFNVSAKIKFGNATSYSPATYSGTTYINKNNSSTQFLQKRTLSGLLLIDGTNYIYNIGNDLIKISEDENKSFSVINHETVSSGYDFDKFNFGHILKTLEDNDVLNVTYRSGRYNLSLHTNFNQNSLLGILNFFDSKTILAALNLYTRTQWGAGLSVNCWVTLNSNNCISKFHFDASVIIKNVFEIGFELEQSFTKYGSGVQITLPSFSNTVTDESGVKTEINQVKNALINSKQRSTSYYDYTVKTTIDHGVSSSNPLGLAVNSKTKGYTKRQIVNDNVYFNNRLQVDSDYKNKDQYGDLVEDYDSYRAKLSTGDVYNVLDPKIGFNKYTLMDGYNNDDVDNYYMLINESFLSFDNLKVVRKSGNTYQFGLTNDAIKTLLKFYNKHFRMDYSEVTVFDIYNITDGFIGKKAYLSFELNDDNYITSIDIDLKGFYVDASTSKQVKFRLECEIDFDYTKSYTAVSKKEDIDNN